MGNRQVKSQDIAESDSQKLSAAECPVINPSGSGGSCPVINDSAPVYNVYNQQINSVIAQDRAAAAASGGSGLFPGLRKGDVALDPTNNMPIEANQRPAPGQTVPLPTVRETSTIPKGGTESTWVYPSPQMFYNALVRKGKAEDVTEADMEAVVSVHNSMNERAWQTVAQWERLHAQECGNPRLMRFLGRPHDLSPKARMHVLMGGDAPFDRHDWYIDRCGKEVRYIIDFYFDESKAGSPDAFTMDSRPALDSFESCLDRIKMGIYTTAYKYGLPCPITGDASTFAGDSK